MSQPAKKSLGQHFLVDRGVLGRILDAAELEPDDVVVEIGPGRGILTRELAARVSRVVAVEIDQGLAQALKGVLSKYANVSIIATDAREAEPESLVGGSSYKVVANLPYYAASPIVRRFLEAEHKPGLMVVMVQREVGQRMAASPGDMSLLSVAVQLYGRPRIVSYAPPRAFRPSPKVTSAIVSIQVYPAPILELDSVDEFFRLVRAGFSAPRKQLRNTISHKLAIPKEDAEALLVQGGVDPRRRAETLSLQEWGSLYRVWRLNYTHADPTSPCQG